MSKVTWLLTPIILIGALQGAAQATPADPNANAAAPTGPGDTLQEVVVTAQKRSENINTVGMSITAATGEQLVQKGVTKVSDLTRIEPSLQFSQSSYGTPIYTIRGVGYFDQSLAAAPTVSIYQDEVAYPFPVMSKGALLDPERVEVLKGPQGTFYGQNATAGAINFIAAKPTSTFTAGIDDTYGRFSDNLLSGFVSGPLTSTLNARLSASIEEGGAWQKSETRDDTLGNKDTQIGRLILDWLPTENFKASLNLNGWKDHSDTQAAQLEGVYFVSPQYISPNKLTPAYLNHFPTPAYYATYPAPIQAWVNQQPTNPTNDRQADWAPGTHPHNDETFYQGSLRLDYSLTDDIGVTSLTSYQRFTEHNLIDEGGVGSAYVNVQLGGNVRSISQELRLHGGSHDGRLHWLVGANYADDRSKEVDFTTQVNSAAFLTGGSPFSRIHLQPFSTGGQYQADTITKSGFGNLDYRVLATVTLHAGARFTQSDQSIGNCTSGDTSITTYINSVSQSLAAASHGPTPTPALPGQCLTMGPAPGFQSRLYRTALDQNNVPWRVGVDWTPIEHELFYFNVSRGYKAGSSPALGGTFDRQFQPVTQESLISYEAGVKSSLFDRQLQLNVAYFHYDYANKQMLGNVIDPILGSLRALVNIPKSVEDGVELSADWRPINGLTFNAAITYLDSRVTSDFLNFTPYSQNAADSINFKGEAFPFTPKWSFQYGARYDWSLTSDLSAFVGADASYQSSSNAIFGTAQTPPGAPGETVKAYGLLNLTAGVQTADNHWRIELWGRNVTNTYYWNTAVQFGDGIVRLAGMPATYGISVRYRY